MMNGGRRVMTLAEFAAYFRVPLHRVHLMRKREAPTGFFKVGHAWLVDLDQFREWMLEQ